MRGLTGTLASLCLLAVACTSAPAASVATTTPTASANVAATPLSTATPSVTATTVPTSAPGAVAASTLAAVATATLVPTAVPTVASTPAPTSPPTPLPTVAPTPGPTVAPTPAPVVTTAPPVVRPRVIDVHSAENYIHVTFDRPMRASGDGAVTVLASYQLDQKPLRAGSSIICGSPSCDLIRIDLPENLVPESSHPLRIAGVVDRNGAPLDPDPTIWVFRSDKL